jgi:putative hemolysin
MRRRLVTIATVVLCAVAWGVAPASASTTWRVQPVPPPAMGNGELTGVSCPASGICMAVGYYVAKATGEQQTLGERWANGAWAVEPTPSPGDTGIEQLTSVSCLSPTDCTAAGVYSSATAYENTLIEHWDGTSWTVVASPNPAGTTTAELDAVSCASATSCTATGLYDGGSGHQTHVLPLAEHWDGTSWTIQHVPLPAGSTSANLSSGVSCPTPTRCIAVSLGLLAEQWNGTRWTVLATPTPGQADRPAFRGVSCSSAKNCTAVGGYLNASNVDEPLVERWNGAAWTIQTDAAPANTTLDGVSCTSGTSCTAVGDDVTGVVAEHWDGTSWTIQPMPARRAGSLSSASCRSATVCTAVGSYGRGHPLAEHE